MANRVSFFRNRRYERLDVPHRSAHGDPWKSEEAYPEVFWWQNVWMAAASWLPVPGIGSYYPHIYLALAAEFFFRSFLFVILGIFVWSVFVELPVYFIMNRYNLLPDSRGVWIQFVVYHKKNPSPQDIEKVMSFKTKYEKPKNGEYYAVFAGRTAGLSPWGHSRAREDMLENAGHDRVKEVYGISYHRRDFAVYVLWALVLDVLFGFLGAWIAWYARTSFGLESFRDDIDWILGLEFVGLFVIIAHLAVYWGWIFTPIAFGYIFVLGAANMDQDVFEWTPYLVFFGLTAYYWVVFFRNPIPMCMRSPWTDSRRNADAPVLMEEISTVPTHRGEPVREHHFQHEEGGGDEDEGTRRRKHPKTPEGVRETAAAEATAEDYSWSWWLFSATNYDTFGYQGWFGSMILLIVIAIVALAL